MGWRGDGWWLEGLIGWCHVGVDRYLSRWVAGAMLGGSVDELVGGLVMGGGCDRWRVALWHYAM